MKYRNGVLSAIFGVIQQVLTLIFGLIVPRLFIQTFGSEMNGLYCEPDKTHPVPARVHP